MKYTEYKQLDLVRIGEEVLKFWEENQIFEKSVTTREGKGSFTFYEGPPSANGKPGIHHMMARTIKDIFCRYQTLKGFQVKRKGGWDTHGLPIELQVEKELGITKEDIGVKISIEEYNRQCRETVMKFKAQWDELTQRMGYWVDLENPYVTFENDYIESLWNLLKRLYDKGLLYKGYTIQPYSPAAGTGLSSHELNLPGTYRDVKDTSTVGMFKVKPESVQVADFQSIKDNLYILAWTTTPWTLPANSALAVGKEITYVAVETFNPYTHAHVHVVLAKDLMGKYFDAKHADAKIEDYQAGNKVIPFRVVAEAKGSELVGIRYEQLLPFVTPEGDAFRVILGDFVSTEDGTGVVHISPTFGADDFRAAQQSGIPPVLYRDEMGKDVPLVSKLGEFVPPVKEALRQAFAGIFHDKIFPEFIKPEYEKDGRENDPHYIHSDVVIATLLKQDGKAFKVEKYEHSYPHCWRTDKPILYYPLDSWFIRTTALKDRMVELNKTINWKPKSTGEGRFGNWLENLVDWNLSRSRYWGTPLPIWVAEINGERAVNGRRIFVGRKADFLKNEILAFNNGWEQIRNSPDYEFYKNEIEQITVESSENIENKIVEYGEFGGTITGFWVYDNGQYLDQVFIKVSYSSDTEKENQNNEEKVNLLIQEGKIKRVDETLIDQLDLHRPYCDHLYFISSDYSCRFIRETDLIDVWFDSGAMPFAQWHYPFDNQAIFNSSYPADFISEGVDQTRGWFFTLHAISVMLEDSVAFKNVVSTGLVLDAKGNKMSKRLGNVVDPFVAISQYGPDAPRWYMVANANPWENLKFDMNGVTEVQRKLFGTLYNTYNFFALYANLDGFRYQESDIALADRPESDRWILSKLHSLVKQVDAAFADYEPTKAARAIQDFTNDDLSNWYVRLNRKRFWKSENNSDKLAAYQTLYTCLATLAKLMSPIAPFFAEQLYRDLNGVSGKEPFESVHLSLMPTTDETAINTDLEERMDLAQRISSLTHSIRKHVKIKVRQPLTRILIPDLNERLTKQIQAVEELIKAEVNIKSVEYINDSHGILIKKIKPNFSKLGRQYGKMMKDIANAVNAFGADDIAQIEKAGRYALSVNGQAVELTLEDVEITSEDIPGWSTARDGQLTVALDITLTEELRQEGIARELVNRIQNLRKDTGLEVQDKIRVRIAKGESLVEKAVEAYGSYIRAEVQAVELSLVETLSGAIELDLDEVNASVMIEKVG